MATANMSPIMTANLRANLSQVETNSLIIIDRIFVLDEDKVAVVLAEKLRVMVLHDSPPGIACERSWLAPSFQQIVRDGVQLRASLPAYLMQRRALLDAHCPL
jgi:hypothetical protein